MQIFTPAYNFKFFTYANKYKQGKTKGKIIWDKTHWLTECRYITMVNI